MDYAPRTAFREFFGGKSTEAQACLGFKFQEIEEISVEGRGNRIKFIPLSDSVGV
jgi:hypothetical protein